MRSKRITGSMIIFIGLLIVTFLLVIPVTVKAEESKFNMSYIYFGHSDLYTYHVDNTKNSLDVISPNYFNVDKDGSMELTEAFDEDFIKEMHERGIKVVPFLSNHWDKEAGKNALINRTTLARQIADIVEDYNLDGVNVDIEGLNEEYRDDYTEFVKILREEMPAEKSLSVAVAANPKGLNKGWQGCYDYESLAKYCDYLLIMAYDEHYTGSEPGPVASRRFVEDSIKYALTKVPKEKIVLGVPFYGRYWKSGSSYGGRGISLTHVKDLLQKYESYVAFDETSMSPKAVVAIKSWEEKPYLFGRRLDAGTYTIWYENERSLKYKLSLVKKYNIKGTGSWSLGQEDPQTWDYYKLWLNGCYFEDAEGHWAQEAILNVKGKGWMIGISDTSFAPNNSLTRAEAATVLVRAFGLEGSEVEYTFKDTVNHWAREEIEIARSNNIVVGIGNGIFEPDRPVTRQEMAVMLDRIFEIDNKEEEFENPYTDVNQDNCSWSYESIIRMTKHGVFKGNPDGAFYPDRETTRAEMATLMTRVSGFIDQGSVILSESEE